MKHAALLFILALLGGCAPESPGPPAAGNAGPNLLVITIDTLRADRLGAYGHREARTPTLDSLAREGVLFSNASTVIPRTTQAIATLFTGLYPAQHGVREVGEKLSADASTLAERLSEAGYATAGISANAVASRMQGLDQGFDRFVDLPDLRARDPARAGINSGRADQVTAEALRWLDEQPEGPWFLWVLYFAPHWPYEPPPAFADGVTASEHPYYQARATFDPRKATIHFNLNGQSAAAFPALSRFYDGEIAYTDHMIGRLLEGVRERGVAPDTLVVVTADHGESLGEHGYWYEHGDFVYQATMRIPLILHQPDVLPQGATLETLVSMVDLRPTLLSLLGVGADAATAGSDLAAAIRNGSDADSGPGGERVVFGESGSALWPQNPRRALGGRRTSRGEGREPFRYARRGDLAVVVGDEKTALYDVRRDPALRNDLAPEQPEQATELAAALAQLPPLGDRWYMARSSRWKLVTVPDLSGTGLELYDLDTDRHETRNVAEEHPEQLNRLAQAMQAWYGSLPAPDAHEPAARTPEEQRELERRLRALGYVE